MLKCLTRSVKERNNFWVGGKVREKENEQNLGNPGQLQKYVPTLWNSCQPQFQFCNFTSSTQSHLCVFVSVNMLNITRLTLSHNRIKGKRLYFLWKYDSLSRTTISWFWVANFKNWKETVKTEQIALVAFPSFWWMVAAVDWIISVSKLFFWCFASFYNSDENRYLLMKLQKCVHWSRSFKIVTPIKFLKGAHINMKAGNFHRVFLI